MTENELKALVSLLDDDDKQITTHVEEKILSLGKEAIPFLEKEWESNLNPMVQSRIEELIHTLQYELLKERLRNWYESTDHDLLTGMWIIATYQYPDIEFEKLVMALPEIEQEELRRLKGIEEELATGESEDGLEIYIDELSEEDLEVYARYCTLLSKARGILKEKNV